ncbi:MAG TPA: tetratricopeptide repeat protein [Steroidobacteraceae bacterium]
MNGQHQTLPQDTLDTLAALLNAGRYLELEQQLQDLLTFHPHAGLAWQLLGVAQRRQGKDAVEALQRATSLLPQDAAAHNNLGNALAQRGQLQQAADSYRRALALNPDSAQAHNNLGNALQGLGQLDQSADSYRRALQIDPDYAEAHQNMADAQLRLGQPVEAISSYRRALALSPRFVEAHHNLANALFEVGRLPEALASYHQALTLRPAFPEAHMNLGNVQRGQGMLEAAIESYRRALALRPDLAAAHANLGVALRLQGHGAQAEASCRRALTLEPESALTLAMLGEMRADQGAFEEAETLLRRAIELQPETAEAWIGLARLRRFTPADASWALQAQRIAQRPLAPRKEVLLRYALGKYHDDLQDYEQAFAHYRRANELSKLFRPSYDRLSVAQSIDRIIAGHDRNQSVPARRNISTVPRPVFIVGMMRSGTTLAEQMLASNPAVFGAGELMYWSDAAARAAQLPAGAPDSAVARLGADYRQLLQRLAPDAACVIDKMPGNFLHLGLIHAALPDARFIHMQRDPIDTCLSIYFQHFEAFHPYAIDLDDLVHYTREYQRLMRHWRALLPQQTLLEVRYEELVEQPERWTRAMLEFIGLPWDPACLDFQRTTRSVLTASKWQVRQKLNRSSIGRWHHYQRFIGPLQQLLDR